MSGTGNGLAVRNGSAPAQQAAAALALRAGQSMWDDKQRAALVAMGIPPNAPSADLAVFLHQCQRTGLDPFAKQIYLIYRQGKPTMQVGIDGYRVVRDRIAKRDGLRVEYEDTIWFGSDGTAYEVWLSDDEHPAACKVAIRVDGRRFASVLRFSEYCQRKADGALNTMWATKGAHQIEKCAEADVLRKAFPNDLAGVLLEDTAPPADDGPPVQRQRVTAEQARARSTVTATVVTPDVPPAGEQAAPASPAPVTPGPAGGTPVPRPATTGQVGMIRKKFTELYPGDETPTERLERLAQTQLLAGRDEALGSTSELTSDEAVRVRKALDAVSTAAELEALLNTGEVRDGE